AAVEKAAKDAGFPLEQLSFRGKTIKYITFGMEGLFNQFPGTWPDFLSLSSTITYAIQDKTLLLASHPMALKRHFLRAEAKGKSLREDPKYASIAARLPAGEWDSHFYFDFGPVIVESRSNVGVSVSSGVAYVGVVAAIAIPTFMRLQSHGGPGGIAGNEML